jgi:ribosomal protein L11 methyltransferase
MPGTEWIELVLPAGALAEEVAALLADDPVAAAGVELRGEDIVLWAPAAEADAALGALRAAAERLAASGLPVDPAGVTARPAVPEDEWRDAWKKHFRVDHVTPRLVIVPSWEPYTPAAGEVTLDLDPGRAFGTGSHASTRLCLRELDKIERRVARFLDVGSGSGILSIAAAKLHPAATGVALDVDPIAVDAARENLERNGVSARVSVGDQPLEALDGVFDLVLANIQADVLEALAPSLAARVGGGGLAVLSGLLTPQTSGIAAIYARAGMEVVATRVSVDDPEWSALVLVKS